LFVHPVVGLLVLRVVGAQLVRGVVLMGLVAAGMVVLVAVVRAIAVLVLVMVRAGRLSLIGRICFGGRRWRLRRWNRWRTRRVGRRRTGRQCLGRTGVRVVVRRDVLRVGRMDLVAGSVLMARRSASVLMAMGVRGAIVRRVVAVEIVAVVGVVGSAIVRGTRRM
jgi:hypothetical protein